MINDSAVVCYIGITNAKGRESENETKNNKKAIFNYKINVCNYVASAET